MWSYYVTPNFQTCSDLQIGTYLTHYLICAANQMTGFYMKRNTGLKWVKANDTDQYKFSLNENHQAIIVDLLKVKRDCKNQILAFKID